MSSVLSSPSGMFSLDKALLEDVPDALVDFKSQVDAKLTATGWLASAPTDVYRVTGNVAIGAVPVDDPLSARLVISNNTAPLPLFENLVNEKWALHIGMEDEVPGGMGLDSFGNGSGTVFSLIDFRRARGTAAAPALVQSGDILGIIGMFGYDGNSTPGTGGYSGGMVQLRGGCQDTWSTTSHPSYFAIRTTATGAIASSESVRVNEFGVGIGTTPSTNNTVNVLKVQDAASSINITNTNAGTSSQAIVQVTSDSSNNTNIRHHSTGRTGTLRYGQAVAGYGELVMNTGSGLLIGTSANAVPIIIGRNNVPVLSFNSDTTATPEGDWIFNTGGKDILPSVNYDQNLGSLTKKYLTLHAAELWVETLVAQNTIATIGGRILVGPTTTLTADLASGAGSIVVKHNQMVTGNRVYMEANGKVEWMAIGSGPTGSGPYTYNVTRDLDGSGANDWNAGDAIFNTGTTGNGFIDIYSVRGVRASSEKGPTIVGNVRDGATYSQTSPRWAIGNLDGLYGYGASSYGVAFGKYADNFENVTIDDTNGLRMRRRVSGVDIVNGQWDLSGNVTLGEVATNQGNAFWNNTNKRLEFRGGTAGTVVHAYVDTDGLIKAGGGNVLIGSTGIQVFGANLLTKNASGHSASLQTFAASGGQTISSLSTDLAGTGTNPRLRLFVGTDDVSDAMFDVVGANAGLSSFRMHSISGSIVGLTIGADAAPNAMLDVRGSATVTNNLGIGTTTFGSSAAKVLALFNGTAPTTSPADTVQLYSVDLSAGNATLGLRTETAVVTENVVSDRTLSVRINGTTYKICLKS